MPIHRPSSPHCHRGERRTCGLFRLLSGLLAPTGFGDRRGAAVLVDRRSTSRGRLPATAHLPKGRPVPAEFRSQTAPGRMAWSISRRPPFPDVYVALLAAEG